MIQKKSKNTMRQDTMKINESEIKTAAEIVCGGVSEIVIVKKGEPNEKQP